MTKKTVFIATYEGPSGEGGVEVFKTRKEAKDFLKKFYDETFVPEDGDPTYKEWTQYGTHSCNIWKRKI